jgi:transcriptional regulator with XRE-family HTH domain
MTAPEKHPERPPGAMLTQLSELRQQLGRANPDFAHGARIEAAAEAYCAALRDQLRRRRQALGWSQAELAEKLEFSQSAVSKLESGRGDLSCKTVFRAAAAMGLKPALGLAEESVATVAAESDSPEWRAFKEELADKVADMVRAAVAEFVEGQGASPIAQKPHSAGV